MRAPYRPKLVGAPRRGVGMAVCMGATMLLAGSLVAGDGVPNKPTAYIVPIHGEINEIQSRSMARRIDEARDAGATIIVFDLDTPGGLVISALDMCRQIKNLPAEIRTVAWVNPQAYSAGAMISLACDEVIMSRSSSIGDCAPILMTPMGGDGEMSDRLAAKAESPILQEFRDSAQQHGYDLLLARAMVKWEQEIWWVRHTETGEQRFVGGEEKSRLVDGVSSEVADEDDETTTQPVAARNADGDHAGEWVLVTSFTDPVSGKDVPLEQPIDRDDSLLTLSQGEAVAFGFAKAIVTGAGELTRYLKVPEPPIVLEITMWELFARWLNSPMVRGMLFVIMLAGAYIEFQSPGLIIPGSVAAVALVIFLAAPYAAGLANTWTIVLLVIGIIFLGVEIFVLPGFGIAGLVGLVLIAIALVGTFVPAEPEMPPFSLPTLQGTWDGIKTGIIVMASSTVVALIGLALMAKYLPYTPFAGRMILMNPEPAVVVAAGDSAPDAAFAGDVGIVTADLRPGGQARFGQRIVDVHSQGEYVEAGTRVQVLEHDGMDVVVRPLPAEDLA